MRSNTTGHARRPSRSQSSLETLLEGEQENGKPAAARVAPKAAPVQTAPRTRPTSSVMSLQTQSHMPRSIFPEVPASRRASTVPVSTSASTFHTIPNAYVPARNQMSRRHTYLAPAPVPAPGPRRDPRPLRSSPLAGPSLALSDDGTLTGSDESADQERRFKPNRISSTPDISTSTLMKLEGRVAASAPPSPQATLRGVPPPTNFTPETTPQKADEPQAPTPSSPPSPARNSSMRRLAKGLRRLSTLSAAPKPSGSDSSSPTSLTPGVSRARSHTVSGATAQSGTEELLVPPVPSIPTWAKSSPNPDAAPAAEASTSKAAADPTPSTTPILRRPSTAPSSPSLLTGSLSRRSSVYGSHETLPSARTPQPPSPSGSTPEQNWLLTSASPRFSRLGLKGDGVVLPLTAKEVRRRSTIRVASNDGADTRSITGTIRSKRSQASLAASTIAEDDVRPPAPAFRRAASASSASVASTASAESDTQTTPSLSRASSESGGSAEEVRTPRDAAQSEFGVLTPGAKEQGTAGVELRVNDVTVEIIDIKDKAERVRAPPRAPADAPVSEKAKRGVPERRNTLKRVWRKLTGGGKG
ncbi:hypothetical protein PsYK624_098030 [Phanerochaete sordida]|uniref:Uncharacterized protein n=1 Tax=Phanerochaete sordida TaxID=48140 RepID=A0A9P3LGD5_9APHY|nr:hypothetical protein PsYK624_098030 [Phanerochaete sordida]